MDQRSFDDRDQCVKGNGFGHIGEDVLGGMGLLLGFAPEEEEGLGGRRGSSDVSGTRQTGRRTTKTRSTPKESEGRRTSEVDRFVKTVFRPFPSK